MEEKKPLTKQEQRRRYLSDLFLFAKGCLGYDLMEYSPHYLLCQDIQKFLADPILQVLLLELPRDVFKALDLDTKIPTPSGIKRLSDLHVGDSVFDSNGKITEIVAESPIEIPEECYEIEFSTGEKVVADAGHLWITSSRKDRDNNKKKDCKSVKTTKEISETIMCRKERNHRIELALPIEAEDCYLPVPPYTLGAWLGDGTSESAVITITEDEILNQINNEKIKTTKRECIKTKAPQYLLGNGYYRCHKRSVSALLRKMNLIKNKHIPDRYLRASFGQRLSLLRGLMDTDGHCSKSNGACVFSGIYFNLVSDARQLAASLGFKPSRIKTYMSKLNGKECGNFYVFHFQAYRDELSPFSLQRKTDSLRIRPKGTCRFRYVVGARKVPGRPVKCLMVDSPSKTYLVTDGFIPTHNSTIAAISLPLWLLVRNPDDTILVTSSKVKTAASRLLAIQRIIESNERFRTYFGDLKGFPWTQDHMNIATRRNDNRQEKNIQVGGVDATNIGVHVRVLIADDLMDEQNYTSIKERQKVNDYWDILDPLMLQQTKWKKICIGTPWSPYDVMQHIRQRENPKRIKVISRSVYETYDGHQGLLFPQRLSEEILEEKRKKLSDKKFSMFYLMRSANEETKPLRREWLHFIKEGRFRFGAPGAGIVEWMDSFTEEKRRELVRPRLTLDPSAGGKTNAVGLTVVGWGQEDQKYLIESWRILEGPSFVIDKIVEMIKRLGVYDMTVEINGYGKMWKREIDRRFLEEKLNITVNELNSRGEKIERIKSLLQPPMRRRELWILPGNDDLVDDLDKFPECNYLDLVDALSFQWASHPVNPVMQTELYGYSPEVELPYYRLHPDKRRLIDDARRNSFGPGERDDITGY